MAPLESSNTQNTVQKRTHTIMMITAVLPAAAIAMADALIASPAALAAFAKDITSFFSTFFVAFAVFSPAFAEVFFSASRLAFARARDLARAVLPFSFKVTSL